MKDGLQLKRVFPNEKRCSMEKKETFWKLIYSIKAKLSIRFFYKFVVKFLRYSGKYAVSRAVLVALLGALEVALLKDMTIQSAFSDDSQKW